MLPKLISFIFATALMLLELTACKPSQDDTPASAAPKTAVSVVTLHAQSVPLTAELPGRVVAALEAEVRPQVAGIVQKQLFQEGSEVKAGDALYQIDPSSYQAAYDSAVATWQKAQAAIPSAQAKASRNRALFQRDSISQQDLEEAEDAFAQAKASVAVARADVETAKINLAYTTITAPISGRTDKSSLTPGALVTASQSTALTTIRQLDPVNVDMSQSSARLLSLRQAIRAGRLSASGADIEVTLKLENNALYPLAGKLMFSESNVDKTTGAYTLRAKFPNPDRLLLPGMYVRAIIEEGTASRAFLVPQRAVSRNTRGEATALFVKNGKVEERVLHAGRPVGNAWLVEDGLNDGEQVIVEGSLSVRDGDAVEPAVVTLDDATGEVHAQR